LREEGEFVWEVGQGQIGWVFFGRGAGIGSEEVEIPSSDGLTKNHGQGGAAAKRFGLA